MLEPDNQLPQEEQIPATPPPLLYSKNAIRGFSVFFCTVFGGVLLMQNFRAIGNKRAANMVLLFSIAYTLGTFVLSTALANVLPNKVFTPALLCNIIGGGILADYFFNRYIPADVPFEKKSIWKALLISLLIMLPFLLAVIYNNGLAKQ